MVMAMGTAISGYVLAEHANEILTWFNEYENDTKTEGTDK